MPFTFDHGLTTASGTPVYTGARLDCFGRSVYISRCTGGEERGAWWLTDDLCDLGRAAGGLRSTWADVCGPWQSLEGGEFNRTSAAYMLQYFQGGDTKIDEVAAAARLAAGRQAAEVRVAGARAREGEAERQRLQDQREEEQRVKEAQRLQHQREKEQRAKEAQAAAARRAAAEEAAGGGYRFESNGELMIGAVS